ncbi:hypothetical protein ACFSMW_06550 [Virgibacillus halophilus]|uniref:Haemolysin XhlA n=1 Tax=Tigheibacillus halophilus TaxID=361280 RepID=A0ABU5C653_9BACI|nr:hypothetical protein [Virgibacillus halophilus]
MSQDKEMDDMAIWQNHEQRITTLEVLTSNMQGEFREVKDKIDKGNDEQKQKLDVIDKRLMDEFFHKRTSTRDNAWKLAMKVSGSLLGAGGVVYFIVDKFF